jgi:hypothetical protein
MLDLRKEMTAISKDSEQGEELLLKMMSLNILVKNKVITYNSALQHFKNWVKDRDKAHAKLKDVEQRIEESDRYMNGHRVDHRKCERARDYSSRVNSDVYGAINSDNFRG